MGSGRRGLSGVVLAVVLFSVATSCARQLTRELVPPTEMTTLDERSPYLKAHRADGGVYVLSEWRVDSLGSAIAGSGTLLDADRNLVASGDFQLAADSIVLFETNVESRSGAATALTIMTGITAAVAGICAASPKTCFGSCPTFYAPAGDGQLVLQAEGFSSSIAPGLEATDVDMLLHTRPTARDYVLRLTNEALETHVVRHADLLAVPRPPEGRVHMTSTGAFFETFGSEAPSRCRAAAGDCLAEVSEAEGDEYFSLADSTDLATREVVDLWFDEVPDGRLGLVVVSRQTLMTTFLVYQALAYMGTDAGRWLAMLETGGEDVREFADGVGRVLGDIEVLAQDGSERWLDQGSVGETGPIAPDTRVVALDLDGDPPYRIRLRMTRGMWRVDQVALVRLGDEAAPVRIVPSRVTREGTAAPEALQALAARDEPLVTLPGDVYEIAYELPENPQSYELFLEARGYYLEWMREEWMSEEDALSATMLLLDPEGAMRRLAPAFKEIEPTIESLFWNSRYVSP